MSVKRKVTVPRGSSRTRAGFLVTPVAKPVRQLAEDDHTEKDEADDQHRRDDVLALLGGGLRERQHRRDSTRPVPRVSRGPALPPGPAATSGARPRRGRGWPPWPPTPRRRRGARPRAAGRTAR